MSIQLRDVVVILLFAACSPSDGGGARDASAGDAAVSCGAAPSWSCVSGTVGGACGDALLQPVCEAGAWTCASDNIRTDQCACLGRPPGACSCSASGWVCGDAGATMDAGVGDAAVSDAATSGCVPSEQLQCVTGTAGGTCGDVVVAAECVNDQWQCADGMVRLEDCACAGRPPGDCTCTASGWDCALDGGGGCGQEPSYACVGGTPGGQCGDALLVPVCGDGGWTCPDDTIPTDQCACLGLPAPNCTCTSDGWVCGDGGSGQ